MPANDFAAPGLGLVPDVRCVPQDGEPRRLTMPLLLETIRSRVAPDSWDAANHAIAAGGQSLFVRQTPDALAWIETLLGNLIARRCRTIRMRADVVAAEAAACESLLAQSRVFAAGAGILSTDEAAAILGRAARGEGGLALAASGEVAGLNGQRVRLGRTFQEIYVRDFDVESATLLLVRAPQMDIAEDGFALDCRPTLSADGKVVNAEIRVRWARCDRPIPVARVNATGARIHLPAMDVAPVAANVVARAGEPMVAGVAGPMKIGEADRLLLTIVRFTPEEPGRD